MRSTAIAFLATLSLALVFPGCGEPDPSPSTNCGNDEIDEDETCDGTNLNGLTCADQPGFTGGTLACNDDCTGYDTSGCTPSDSDCGNDELDGDEVCDGTNLNGQTCADQPGFTGGALACNDDCTGYDTSGCTSCGIPSTDVTSSLGSSTLIDTTSESDDFTPSCGLPGTPDALLSFVAPNSANYVFDTKNNGTNFDTLLWAFRDCSDPVGTEITCHDDYYEGYPTVSTIMVPATAGETIYVLVDGKGLGGTAEVSITEINCTDDAFEDNDTAATAAPIDGPFPVDINGVMCPDDITSEFGYTIDYYAVTIPAGGVLNAALSGGTMTDCDQLMVYFQIWDEDKSTILAESWNFDGTCPEALSAPGLADEATTLLVVVGEEELQPTRFVVPLDYTLTLITQATECGNNIVELGEECDDGNEVPQDGCENDCTFSIQCYAPADRDLGTLIDGETVETTTDLTLETRSYRQLSCIGSDEIGEDYMYSFTISEPGTIAIEWVEQNFEIGMTLFAADESCGEIDCFFDAGTYRYSVVPGDYRFVLQAIVPTDWADGNPEQTLVNFTFDAVS